MSLGTSTNTIICLFVCVCAWLLASYFLSSTLNEFYLLKNQYFSLDCRELRYIFFVCDYCDFVGVDLLNEKKYINFIVIVAFI